MDFPSVPLTDLDPQPISLLHPLPLVGFDVCDVDRYAKGGETSIKIDYVRPLGENAAMATGNYDSGIKIITGDRPAFGVEQRQL